MESECEVNHLMLLLNRFEDIDFHDRFAMLKQKQTNRFCFQNFSF